MRLHRNHIEASGAPPTRNHGSRQRSMLLPAKPITAGSNVTDASIVTRTVVALPTATPSTNANPISSIPSSEMTTVVPAKSTARPDVIKAARLADSGSWPAWRCWR
jgi:hypothetical protein